MEKYLNKITCGDCYELIKELPDNSVDLIYTDIPYDFEANGGADALVRKVEIITKNTKLFPSIPTLQEYGNAQ